MAYFDHFFFNPNNVVDLSTNIVKNVGQLMTNHDRYWTKLGDHNPTIKAIQKNFAIQNRSATVFQKNNQPFRVRFNDETENFEDCTSPDVDL